MTYSNYRQTSDTSPNNPKTGIFDSHSGRWGLTGGNRSIGRQATHPPIFPKTGIFDSHGGRWGLTGGNRSNQGYLLLPSGDSELSGRHDSKPGYL